jgi:hypothetical protein
MNLSFLDDIPLATVITLVGILGAVIALIAGSIDFEEFMLAIGATTGGAGVLGLARNGAGTGLRKAPVVTQAEAAKPVYEEVPRPR